MSSNVCPSTPGAPRFRISDSYGVFVYDPDAGYARGFAPSCDFSFYGWRNGVMVMRHKDGTLYSCLTGIAFDGPKKGDRLQPVPTLVSDWGFWLKHYPGGVAYDMFEKYQPVELPKDINEDSRKSRGPADKRLPADEIVLGVWTGKSARAYPVAERGKGQCFDPSHFPFLSTSPGRMETSQNVSAARPFSP